MKRRKDSFFGIHCDYHAQPWMGTVGTTLCEEDIRKVCRELKPDFWQIDCKGHFGWATYPSTMGNAMPDFAVDTLAMYRKVTREEGVALYMHYSGVWDDKYCKEHPEDCVLRADGSRSTQHIYWNSKYADNFLIPQLSELVEKYGIDGVWIDGECWAWEMDYHPETIELFQKETGIDLGGKVPVGPEDPYIDEFREFNRELFRRHVRHYTDVLHAKYPELQITSNYIFTVHMPEKVSAGVDFLSGDNMPDNAYISARYVSRYMPQQNIPWDIMGMGQKWTTPACIDILPAHPVQVMQQAAASMSFGGGFQIGLSSNFDNSPNMINLLSFKPAAEFIRAREKFTFKGQLVPQAAIFLSTHDRYTLKGSLFDLHSDRLSKCGLTSLLCDCGQSFEIVSEHTLLNDYNKYKMIAVAETRNELSEESVRVLMDYAKNGGSLFLVGRKTCEIFAAAGAPIGVAKLTDYAPEGRFLGQQHAPEDERFFTVDDTSLGGVLYPVEITADAPFEVVASTCYSSKSPRRPFAIIKEYGQGKIAAVGADLGLEYSTNSQYMHRKVAKIIVDKLYTPLARIENALGFLDLTCLTKDGKLMLQLSNANGNHNNTNCATEDFIPPVVDIRLSIAMEQPPKKLIFQPDGKELAFEFVDGRVYFDIDRVNIHNVIEVVM